MRSLLLVLLLVFSGVGMAETFNECILENMKGVGSREGAFMVRKACRDKVLPYVPKKCKEAQSLEFDRLEKSGRNPLDAYDENNTIYQHCINSCLNASYWSKHFGDCAP